MGKCHPLNGCSRGNWLFLDVRNLIICIVLFFLISCRILKLVSEKCWIVCFAAQDPSAHFFRMLYQVWRILKSWSSKLSTYICYLKVTIVCSLKFICIPLKKVQCLHSILRWFKHISEDFFELSFFLTWKSFTW